MKTLARCIHTRPSDLHARAGGFVRVPLTKGYCAIVDAADLPLLEGWHWQVCVVRGIHGVGRRFARGSRGKGKRGEGERVWMHRLILPGPHEVKHRDGDGLNNRRSNLMPAERRHLSHAKRKFPNMTSKFRGVSWDKARGKWKAQITDDKGHHFLGRFDAEEDAAAAYDEAAVKAYGDFAATNFPPSPANHRRARRNGGGA